LIGTLVFPSTNGENVYFDAQGNYTVTVDVANLSLNLVSGYNCSVPDFWNGNTLIVTTNASLIFQSFTQAVGSKFITSPNSTIISQDPINITSGAFVVSPTTLFITPLFSFSSSESNLILRQNALTIIGNATFDEASILMFLVDRGYNDRSFMFLNVTGILTINSLVLIKQFDGSSIPIIGDRLYFALSPQLIVPVPARNLYLLGAPNRMLSLFMIRIESTLISSFHSVRFLTQVINVDTSGIRNSWK
jgi:hypothetical protein